MANKTCIEIVALRLVLETDTSPRSAAETEQANAFTRDVLAAFRPRPLASTRASSSNVVPFRKVGAR